MRKATRNFSEGRLAKLKPKLTVQKSVEPKYFKVKKPPLAHISIEPETAIKIVSEDVENIELPVVAPSSSAAKESMPPSLGGNFMDPRKMMEQNLQTMLEPIEEKGSAIFKQSSKEFSIPT